MQLTRWKYWYTKVQGQNSFPQKNKIPLQEGTRQDSKVTVACVSQDMPGERKERQERCITTEGDAEFSRHKVSMWVLGLGCRNTRGTGVYRESSRHFHISRESSSRQKRVKMKLSKDKDLSSREQLLPKTRCSIQGRWSRARQSRTSFAGTQRVDLRHCRTWPGNSWAFLGTVGLQQNLLSDRVVP